MIDFSQISEQIRLFYSLDHWWAWITRPVTILLVALIVRWFAQRAGKRFFHAAHRSGRLKFWDRRARTVESLMTGLTSLVVFTVAIIVALNSLGAPADSLLFAVGLFSAAFGLGARPLVSDYLAGITLIFENLYAFGEKVEIMEVTGLIEQVGLRTTQIRAASGELFVVPNGDVRVVRNFSRAAFSPASIRVSVKPQDLNRTLDVLEKFAAEAPARYGNEVVDHAEVVSEMGEIAAKTQLVLVVRAPFMHGAQMRRRLMADVYTALAEAGVTEFA